MASFSVFAKYISNYHHIRLQFTDHTQCSSPFSSKFVSFRVHEEDSRSPLSVSRNSYQSEARIDHSSSCEVPLLSSSEVIKRLRSSRESHNGKQQFLAMYSSVFGGITKDPAVMMIPMDDHMVHRGHGVFDTATIMDGYLYELDQHLDRFLKSASMGKITLPFPRDKIRSILIQTVSASKCKQGSLRYWLSSGPGDFQLSPSSCCQPSLYAIVIQDLSPPDHSGIKVVTSSIPIKPPTFATMKSVNYLPNVLCKMEAEEQGCFASIWLDQDGFVAEGPNMNVGFVTKEKEFVMPRFEKILSGCTAKRVISSLVQDLLRRGLIGGVSLREVSVEEGKKADEMMLIGSGVLVRPVLQWDEQIIGDGKEGPVAKALLDLVIMDMKAGPSMVRTSVPYQTEP